MLNTSKQLFIFFFSLSVMTAMGEETSLKAVLDLTDDLKLLPPSEKSLTIYSLSGWACKEKHLERMSNPERPLYHPYNDSSDEWWDNLLAEQMQARLPVLMLASRKPADEKSGNMNPKDLHRAVAAFKRAGIDPSLMKVANFIDTAGWKIKYDKVYGTGDGSTNFDLGNMEAWDTIVWEGLIKPWFDIIPKDFWYSFNGRPIIHIWGLNPAGGYYNHRGNVSKATTWLADTFERTYDVRPMFIYMKSQLSRWGDNSLQIHPDVLGFDPWFGQGTDGYAIHTHNGFTHVTGIPAYQENNPDYKPGHVRVPRRGGETLRAALQAARNSNADQMLVEGWTNYQEAMGLYRSEEDGWTFPNQCINIIREYTDPHTKTIRLEAEGCDYYHDKTSGNAGGEFRRSGDLDIYKQREGYGWIVGNVEKGEWIEHKDVYFSEGNYRISLKYSSPKKQSLRVSVDGIALEDASVPVTVDWKTYGYLDLGEVSLSTGVHTIRLEFITGNVHADWLFVKKLEQ